MAVTLGLGLQSALPGSASAAPAGQGFTLNAGDIRFILKQIKIAEAHATREGPNGEPVPGQPLFGPGANQVASALLPYGLRTVDGTYNNGQPGQSGFGTTYEVFPRHAAPSFRDAESAIIPGMGSVNPNNPELTATTYKQKKGNVVDSQPRVISNLIVDQTAANPAAVAAAGKPPRTHNNTPSAVPCTTQPTGGTPGSPAGCTPAGETLFIPNITTDFGLSPPFNSWFTLFGQFFDHGIDLTAKGGGTVFVPLKADDPLIPGRDRVLGTADDLPPHLRFMVLTRAKNQPGPDGVLGDNPATPADESADDVQDASNLDSAWVDLSQTYTSHSSHQVFLREYTRNADGRTVATGKMLEGEQGGMPTWARVKWQARTFLGIQLADTDILNVPMVAADEYGRFLRGPNGNPQIVTASGLVEGNPAAPVAVPANAMRVNIAFLDDIAHHAKPASNLTPDADTAITPATGRQPAGTYDDEMLDAHFLAGDGRVNENIGLTAIHQVFHAEHNRLIGDITQLILSQNIDVDEWRSETGAGGWNGERLFQAARFVAEMEYQHIVFEEFARKVQPGINAFNPFTQSDTGINPQIRAEFAHAVYRFGHSMLTDTVARTNNDGSRNDIALLDAFLNPPSYYDDGEGGRLSPEAAAGSIAMGMTDQIGNELDEFVTEALRNNLLGLPLDLATLNITRARETGVPSLNNFRKQVHRATNDSGLQPYSSWIDFGLSIKHPESIINFMAAYGQHPTIRNAATAQAKREAARLIYENDPALNPGTPEDAYEFVHSIGPWENTGAGASRTGLDDVDLWVGGLAESTVFFGGLLGSTFNYVFERQLTDLQDGDRLYYLSRTAGLNLQSQLDGNSFAELVMRNTDAAALKADVFATADCEFELANLGTSGAIPNDPASECDETKLLIRMPDGTIRYRQNNSVDPPGLNAQSTFNGTSGNDRMWGGIDNDTFWGNEGNDRIEGNDGADSALGGDGDDIITDIAGDDFHKGGDGNDAIDGGPGLDILMGGNGKDFTNGGLNGNETFSGEGDDFAIAGDGPDTVWGGGGDDWLEGGNANDLLQGDSGAVFFDDLNDPGHDVMIGDSGEDDYDAEGGDDIMVAGPGIERNHGAFGFDWSTHARDPQAADSDLTIAIGAGPIQLADRYLLVEGLSGGAKDDILKGDDVIPSDPDTELNGGPGRNVLNAAGIARIAGLAALLPPGTQSWGEGNIIIGGAGSDVIHGRGANDIIDGDRWLNVRLSVRTNPADPATEIRSVNSLTEIAADVFAGRINPGNIVIVREILSNPNPGDVDTAVFAGVRADYDITFNGDSVTVAHVRNVPGADAGAPGGDGTDTLRNIEALRFADQVVPLRAPDAPTIGTATPGPRSATVTWTAPAEAGAAAITGYRIRVVNDADEQVGAIRTAPADATSAVVTGLTDTVRYRIQVAAVNAIGVSPYSAFSNPVVPQADVVAPTVTATSPANNGVRVAVGANITATFSEGVQAVTGTTFQLRETATGALVPAAVTYNAGSRVATLNPTANLKADTNYTVSLSNGITDLATPARNALAPVSWSFLTGPEPTLTSRTPAVGATNVSRVVNITAVFSENVTGVTGTSVRLQRVSDGAFITAAVRYDASTRTVTLDPTATLGARTQYRVVMTETIRDTAGNPILPTSWTFTTGA
ncbi:Animal haem peroxidase [Micromonospora pattaloongensis]|uniref:Animal haem peroxidase n=2 Tax=Micromonospora pattaloongensis TaxID=405436 RepID=A0A1H3LWZ9_9ACTN|nr:Animal haem peroxidase [Micromonospora pattaloongensis]